MDTRQIMINLINNNTGGYFYKENCRINHSSITGWYCKDFINGKMQTYNINDIQTEDKIIESFENAILP